MKLKTLLALAVAASLAIIGCKKEEEQSQQGMTIAPAELSFAASGELTKIVSVTSSKDWKVVGTQDWVKVTVDGVDASQTAIPASSSAVQVQVTVTENNGYERSVELSFTGGTLAKGTLKVTQAGTASFTTIAQVRDMLTGESVTLGENIVVKATCISNSTLGNLGSKKSAYVQDETGGLNIFCAEEHSMKFGDVVTMNLSGQKLDLYKGLYEVNGLPLANISTLSTGNKVEPKKVSAAEFVTDKYQGQYVAIDNVQVADADLSKKWYNGTSTFASISVVSKTGETFVVSSSKYSSFKDETVAQGSGTIAGIASVYNDGAQLIFAQTSDWAGLTGNRFTIEVPEVNTDKVSVAMVASAGAKVTLNNVTVVATATTLPDKDPKTSFLVTDAEKTDFLFIYHCNTSGIKVGDNVSLVGTMATYASMPQITTADVTVNSHGTWTDGTAKDITSGFDSYKSSVTELVSYKGTLSKSGSYINVAVNGASAKTGSILTPDVIDISGVEGVPNTTFTGYYLYTTSSKFNYIMLTKVETSSDPYLILSPTSQKVAATATSATINVSANVDSYSVTVDGGAEAVKSGNTITVTFPANTSSEDKTYTVTANAEDVGDVKATITQEGVASAGTIELTFPDDNSAKNKVSAYASTWTAQKGSNNFSIVNFNNNNWSNWTYIKCGTKNGASVATITTDAALGFEVSKVVVTVDKVADAKLVNSTKLEVASDAAFSKDLQTVNVTLSAAGDIEYVVPKPESARYYKITFDCAKASANGLIQISKVTYKAK